MRRLIRDMGRVPAERTTTYQLRRVFGAEEDDHFDPLDLVGEETDEQRFGSYQALTRSDLFRYKRRNGNG